MVIIMSDFTKEKIDALASSLLIGLTKEENDLVLNEFKYIKENMDIISNIPGISDVEPLTHPVPVIVSLDEDEFCDGEDIKNVLQNADATHEREIKVPKVVGE